MYRSLADFYGLGPEFPAGQLPAIIILFKM